MAVCLKRMNKASLLFIPIIITAVVLSYVNSLHNEFIWDDEDWVLKNSTVKDWHQWPHLFVENSIQGARKGSNFYRPLQGISHGMDYMIWKYSLPGHHITNIIFHALTAIVLFFLLARIFSGEMAFLSALFFSVHPVQTEAVTYITGRADPMAGLFILLAVLLFERNIILSCLAFIFAILSKESGLIAPVLIILYAFFSTQPFPSLRSGLRGPRSKSNKALTFSMKGLVQRILPFIAIIIIYGVLRLTILNFSSTIPESAPKAFFYIPFYIRLCTFLKTLPVYFGMLLWPFGLHMERGISLSYSMFEPQTASGLFIVIALLLSGFWLRKRHRFLLFSTLWFLIFIFPNSNIIPVNALLLEHWLYLPSIGFFIAVSWALERMLKKGRGFKLASIVLIISLTLFYMWRTFERNKEWHDPISFYESTIKYKSDSARIHNNLAMAYADAGREDDAMKEYTKAIELGDYYPQPHFNLSNIYIKKKDYEAAVKELKRSMEIDNDFLYSHENLALIYFDEGKFNEAKKEAVFILKREPNNKIALEIIGRISE